MPQKKPVTKLEDLSFMFIIEEIKNISNEDVYRMKIFIKRMEFIITYTESFLGLTLPPFLWDKLFEKLSSSNLKMAELLLNERISRVRVSGHCQKSFLQNVSRKCKDLKHLSISEHQSAAKDLKTVILTFSTLTSLEIISANCTDSLLQTVLLHCQNLKELRIPFNKISDKGFTAISTTTQVKCRETLVLLDVRNENLSTLGLTWILKCFPNLKSLGAYNVLETLKCVVKELKASNKKLSLKQFLSNCPISASKVKSVIEKGHSIKKFGNYDLSICPFVSKVDMRYCHLGCCLEELSQLRELQELRLFACGQDDKSIPKLLKICGKQLNSLELVNSNITVSEIAKYCPNLKKLCLNQYMEIDLGDINSLPNYPFEHLEELTVGAEKSDRRFMEWIGASVMRILLQHCKNLKSLKLLRIVCLDDVLFREIIKDNPFLELESLYLERLISISPDIIFFFLEKLNKLRMLQVLVCPEISCAAKNSIYYYIRKNNLDVSFFYQR